MPWATRHPARPRHRRKADGGGVVAPPSRHPDTGRPYRWADFGARVEEVPPRTGERVCRRRPAARTRPSRRPTPSRAAGAASRPDRLMDTLTARIHAAPNGPRHVTLFGCARGAARMVGRRPDDQHRRLRPPRSRLRRRRPALGPPSPSSFSPARRHYTGGPTTLLRCG
ncbi:bifunctional DNA primase/polymerase [Catellatospora tritici]|uniref:bifunctional DNA primase/polymerase n=1 Tax=Catellatospora tritici TaxID=2851566 RepID=UPI00355711DD